MHLIQNLRYYACGYVNARSLTFFETFVFLFLQKYFPKDTLKRFIFLKVMLDIFQEIRKNSGYHNKIILSMLKRNVVANIMA